MMKMRYRSPITRASGNTASWAAAAVVMFYFITTIALFLPTVGQSDSEEDHDHDHERARELRAQGKIVSLESIVKQAQQIKPGNILEIELKDGEKKYRYEVEILGEDGKVWELLFDGATGQLLQTQQEH